ncbi:MAG: pantoate--beta-alanine ligase [Planctomycetes bacterium]|nr:pantoate--beta-alanine ligase [Planctomycetota bacterium]
MQETVSDPLRMRSLVLEARAAGRRVGFVPTMGALHAGHASLVERAARECNDVAVSIFINPTQFGPQEDFTRYPRTRAADCALLEPIGTRWIYAPEVSAVYPPGDATRIVVGGPALRFEGALRPGHFDGVATVVCRLLQAVPATTAYFGAKDWQQTLVVRRMVTDLGLPVEIVVCPTVREADGLAMSSRNAYLASAERHQAVALFDSLKVAEQLWSAGAGTTVIEQAMRETMRAGGVVVDYTAVADPETLEPLAENAERAVALVAGRLGATRLIDNIVLPCRGDTTGGRGP